jgi:hypothetical protein
MSCPLYGNSVSLIARHKLSPWTLRSAKVIDIDEFHETSRHYDKTVPVPDKEKKIYYKPYTYLISK